jgi:hypothetical protein
MQQDLELSIAMAAARLGAARWSSYISLDIYARLGFVYSVTHRHLRAAVAARVADPAAACPGLTLLDHHEVVAFVHGLAFSATWTRALDPAR